MDALGDQLTVVQRRIDEATRDRRRREGEVGSRGACTAADQGEVVLTVGGSGESEAGLAVVAGPEFATKDGRVCFRARPPLEDLPNVGPSTGALNSRRTTSCTGLPANSRGSRSRRERGCTSPRVVGRRGGLLALTIAKSGLPAMGRQRVHCTKKPPPNSHLHQRVPFYSWTSFTFT